MGNNSRSRFIAALAKSRNARGIPAPSIVDQHQSKVKGLALVLEQTIGLRVFDVAICFLLEIFL